MGTVAATILYRAVSWHYSGFLSHTVLPIFYLGSLSLLVKWQSRVRAGQPTLQRALLFPVKLLVIIWRLLMDLSQPASTVRHQAGKHGFVAAPARCPDLWELAAFDHLIFPKTSSRVETFFYLLRIKLLGQCTLFTVREQFENRIIGTVYLRPVGSSGVGFISNVGMHPEYQRKKLAHWMMQTLALPAAHRQGMSKLVLNVRETFVQRFYEKLGFQRHYGSRFEIDTPTGELPMFLELGEKTARLVDRSVVASSRVS